MEFLMSSAYRIDTFAVPDHSRHEFEATANGILNLLRRQPGCVQAQWFEKVGGPGRFDVVTVVEWDDMSRQDAVREVVQRYCETKNLSLEELSTRLQVEESKAVYVLRNPPEPSVTPA
jgi:heme-degrading monooxygenase HmoA